ncbi:outer membrane protein H [Treponema paraluiscuniculi Cuniculi A]|uniref:Outer membrane protein H n=4 Tax=Treponema TaxID=157 RepID=F7XSE1_TREPU|nr:OmpH family outer membrane protein [Treponema paraluiscuniculi]AEH40269.1 outer membrane protein H [Treponema paraluiscuniculi Cuniculi A]WKC72197.1 outer membrane protein H [Treponema paraluiscuniculi]
MKAALTFVFMLLTSLLQGQSQHITRFAVIDAARIYSTFWRDSRVLRDYESKKARHQGEIQKMSDELVELRQKKVDAQMQQNIASVQKYEVLIASKTALLLEYSKTSNDELTALRKTLIADDAFYAKLYAAIRRIAESEGYSIVLDLQKNAGILWYSHSVDITEDVLRELSSS